MEKLATTTTGILDEFQAELVKFWQQLPNKAFFFSLLAAWFFLFHVLGNSTFGYVDTPSLFRWMLNSYLAKDSEGNYSEDDTGLWVPLLVLGLYWWKRKELIELPIKMWWPGLLIAAFAMLLHVAGYLIQQPRVSIMALLLGIYGFMGLAWGDQWLRRSFFPFFLLLFCIPFARLVGPITTHLQILVCVIVEFIAHDILGIGVIREGTILRDPTGQYRYDVVAACSGIRSLITIGLMATAGAFLGLRGWWRRILLIACAAPLAVIGNAIRLLMIVLAGELWGQSAGNYVHEGGPGGIISLLPYGLAFVGLFAMGSLLNKQKAPGSVGA